ncbi:MAG: rhodanese-like domain-containing protein [Thermodesulfobacteriota bacterium]
MQRFSVFTLFTTAILLTFFHVGDLRAAPYSEISAPLLNHMIKADKRLMLIHVLSEIEYDMYHIEGSINIPIDKLVGSDNLPEDKDIPIVFYCMGHR